MLSCLHIVYTQMLKKDKKSLLWRRCESALRDAVLHAARQALVVHVMRGLRGAAAPPPCRQPMPLLAMCKVR